MSWYRLQLWSNFSYFLFNPVQGDGIEQNDKRYLVGNNLTYRRNYSLGVIPTETLLGFQSRYDHIKVGLFNQEKRHRLSTTNDNLIRQINLSWFAHQEIQPTNWFRGQFFVVFQNLANTKWRSAEHVLVSRLQNEPPEGVLGSSFTPGDPFTAKAGVTINPNLW